jgi:ElaA protein
MSSEIMSSEISWQWNRFTDLAPHALYAALRARSDVFVVEQSCVFLDLDDVDQAAWHLLAWVERDGPRALGPGCKFAEASIGRVLTTRDFRRTGVGRALMSEGVRKCLEIHPGQAIRIGAQRYLEAFYAGFGFRAASEPYLEDGIEHVEMLRSPAR